MQGNIRKPLRRQMPQGSGHSLYFISFFFFLSLPSTKILRDTGPKGCVHWLSVFHTLLLVCEFPGDPVELQGLLRRQCWCCWRLRKQTLVLKEPGKDSPFRPSPVFMKDSPCSQFVSMCWKGGGKATKEKHDNEASSPSWVMVRAQGT